MSPLKILITAGPTREPIDPVRYISNRSSGKMGYAIAEAAAEAGHEVELISGPVHLAPPASPLVTITRVETAQEMFEAVEERIGTVQAAILTAAVADYRPVEVSEQKIKKTQQEAPVIRLEKTADILGSCRQVFGFKGVLIGFAAETQKVVEYARDKLDRKECDLIVANDVSRTDIGFDSNANEILLVSAEGERPLPKASKSELARQLIDVMEGLAEAKGKK